MILKLVPHPAHPPRAIEYVNVDVTFDQDGAIGVEYHVRDSSALHLPEPGAPERADELWKTTCFELFFKPAGGEAYLEFNFSPSCKWAGYAFDGYRSGMCNSAAEDPDIVVFAGNPPVFSLMAEPWPSQLVRGPGLVSLSAVIEEKDGTKSFWALAHPPEKPDFHHADCFVLELPAPEAP